LFVVPSVVSLFLVGALSSVVAAAGPGTPGQQLWVTRFNGSGNSDDSAYALGVSPGGSRLFVTGPTSGATSSTDYGTEAYSASNGAHLWGMRYNGPGNSGDDSRAIAVSPDGSRVFVTGNSRGSTSGNDYATVAYDAATGAQLWVARYDGPGSGADFAYAIAVAPGGAIVFVTGYSTGVSTGADYTTIAYQASTGAELWVARYNGAGNRFDEAFAVKVSPDASRVFVTGYTTTSNMTTDYGTVAYDAATGAQLWGVGYNGTANLYDIPYAIAVSPGGSTLFVTGHSTGSGTHEDATTVAYDASTGAQIWVKSYNGPGDGYDSAFAIAMSPGGSAVFVTGQSWGSGGGYDYVTLAYDTSNGTRLWLNRYDGPSHGEDGGQALAVAPGGSTVFVTGSSEGSNDEDDYTTIAYDGSTGGRLWLRRYDGPAQGTDDAWSVGVSPGGAKVFVTGGSEGSNSGSDFATVAYSTV
jgi:hypothetical protein